MQDVRTVIEYPENVKFITNRLISCGFSAYIVGGCVRDSIMHREIHDWDITTDALPDDIESCFEGFRLILSGKKHGTVGVIIDRNVYEITTFRCDGEYIDNRHPEKVEFTSALEEDLKRRDFTVNAMAYSSEKGLIDPFGGVADIKNGIIRCVGEPHKRFTEDALRIMRALRFSATLGYSIDTATSKAITELSELLTHISVERITAEFNQIICSDKPSRILDEYRTVFYRFIPELEPLYGFEQHNLHHDKDVWKHTLCALDIVESDLEVRIATLFHDICKPQTFYLDSNGVGHFIKHAVLGETAVRKILKRLRYPNRFIDTVSTFVRYHELLRDIRPSNLKRIAQRVGLENMDKLLELNKADILAQSDFMREDKLKKYAEKKAFIEELKNNKSCLGLKDMAVSGRDIIDIGINDGILIGQILHTLLNEIIEDRLENNRDILLRFVRDNYL